LACPSCLGPLELEAPNGGEIESGLLTCARDGSVFPIRAGVPRLVSLDRVAAIATFEEYYAKAWASEGWGSSDPAYFLNLPYRDITGRHRREWRVKARSLETLLALLRRGNSHRIADLGCGTGWLSYRLHLDGYEVYAIDILISDSLGLGAARVYQRDGPAFERVQGELNRPPLADHSMDAVICNASIHYALDLPQTVREIRRVLRSNGIFIVMNSPIHSDASSARRSEAHTRKRLIRAGAGPCVAQTYRHLSMEDLDQAVGFGFQPFREEPFDAGRGFRLTRRAKTIILRTELASFPIIFTQPTST